MSKFNYLKTFTPEMPQIVTETGLGRDSSPQGYEATQSGVEGVTGRSAKTDLEAQIEYYTLHLQARKEAQRQQDAKEAVALSLPRVKTVEELLDSDTPPERVKGLIPSGATMNVVAQAKAGKTTFILNLAKSLLDGTPFLDHFDVAPEEGSIAYLNYEMPDLLLGSYCKKLGIGGDRFKVVDMRAKNSTMKTRDGRSMVAQMLQGCTTLIIDSFGKAFTGTDQNDNSEVSNWFDVIKEFGEEIGVNETYNIVHAGKNLSRGARGASALEDAPDVILTLSLANPDRPADSRRIIESRGRWQDLSPHYIDMDKQTTILTLGEEKGTGRRAQSPQGDLSQQILAFAAKSPGASTKEIKDAMKARNETVGRELRKLVDAGELQSQKQGRATLYFLGSRVREG